MELPWLGCCSCSGVTGRLNYDEYRIQGLSIYRARRGLDDRNVARAERVTSHELTRRLRITLHLNTNIEGGLLDLGFRRWRSSTQVSGF